VKNLNELFNSKNKAERAKSKKDRLKGILSKKK
jgi:hypothetical protein